MNIRIQNDSLSGAVAPGTGRTDEVSHPPASSTTAAGKTSQRGGDSVAISSLSQSVAAASSAHDVQQASRVTQLTALYRGGNYSVDSSLVSHAMVSQALNATAAENN